MALLCAVIFAGSAVLAVLLTWVVRNVAARWGLAMAAPTSRHIHLTPVPRLGGVAVFATFATMFCLYLAAAARGWMPGPTTTEVSRIFVIAVAFFAVGLVDDLRTLGAWSKLVLQIFGGAALYFWGIHFGICQGLSFQPFWNRAVCLAVTVLWVVLICNAINLIDGIDGLAAGAALFSMVTIFSFAVGGTPGVAMATVILAGSLLGFLVFNFNPASIFLGDSGSLFVGFMLSGFVLAESGKQQSALDAIFVPLMCFALPLTEVAISILRRFLSGHSLFGADRNHIHHKLLEMGLSQRQAVAMLYGVSALCTLLSLALRGASREMVISVSGVLLLVLFFGLRMLGYQEFGELGRVGWRMAQQKKVFARNIRIRRASSLLESTHDLTQVVEILDNCLRDDFDGFEIILDEEFAQAGLLPVPWHQGAVSRCWNSSGEELALTMELAGSLDRPIGKISLYQSARNGLPIETDLLAGPFRRAVAVAIQNALGRPRTAIPALEQPSSVTMATTAGSGDDV